MRDTFLNTIVLDKLLISPKLYMFIIRYPTLSIDIKRKINRTYTPFGDAYLLLTWRPVTIYSDIRKLHCSHDRKDCAWKFPQPVKETARGPQREPEVECDNCAEDSCNEPSPTFDFHIKSLLMSGTFSDTIVLDKLSSSG